MTEGDIEQQLQALQKFQITTVRCVSLCHKHHRVPVCYHKSVTHYYHKMSLSTCEIDSWASNMECN